MIRQQIIQSVRKDQRYSYDFQLMNQRGVLFSILQINEKISEKNLPRNSTKKINALIRLGR